MALYCGIDLHSNNVLVSVIDEMDRVVYERRLGNDLERILMSLSPSREALAGVAVEGRMTQSDIAARIGASREMVSRILSDLKTGGYVSQGRHRIVIHRKLPADW